MTPDEIRKKYRFPERVKDLLAWVFYLKGETRPTHWLSIQFIPTQRAFSATSVTLGGPRGLSVIALDADDSSLLRSLLPAVAIAQCTASSINPPDPPEIVGGRVWSEPDANTPADIAIGKLTITFER